MYWIVLVRRHGPSLVRRARGRDAPRARPESPARPGTRGLKYPGRQVRVVTATAGDEERLVTGYGGRLFLAVSAGWLFLQGGRLVLSPLLPSVRADLSLTNAEAGFAFTVLWGLYALLQYPSGRLSDRLSRKTLLVAGLAIAAAGFAVIGLTATYPQFILGAAVVGLGVGLYPTAARALVSDLFVERRGQAFGLHTASGSLGGLLAAGLATLVIAVSTWRVAYLPVVASATLVALALHVWSREPYRVAGVDLAVRETGRRLLGTRRFRGLLAAYALFALSWQSATAFLPTFLLVEKGFAPAVANAGFAAYFLVGTLVKPVSGGLGDRFRRDRLAPAALALGAAMLAGVLLVEAPALVALGVVAFAAGLMAFPPLMQAHLMDAFPTESMGGDLGGMRTIYIAIGALGPTAVGLIADVASLSVAFAGLVGCMLLGGALVVVVER